MDYSQGSFEVLEYHRDPSQKSLDVNFTPRGYAPPAYNMSLTRLKSLENARISWRRSYLPLFPDHLMLLTARCVVHEVL